MRRGLSFSGASVYLVVLFLLSFASAGHAADSGYYMAVYAGEYTDASFVSAVGLKRDPWKSYIGVLALGKKFESRLNGRFRFETELQIVKHEGLQYFSDKDPASGNPGWNWADGFSYESRNSGHHTHGEFNLVLIARWLDFPWDDIIDTSIAIGEGISYATENPPVEIDQHALFHGFDYPVSKWLNYLMVEYTFSLPRILPEWSAYCRIHHRSGIYGIFNNYRRGSDFLSVGLRYDY